MNTQTKLSTLKSLGFTVIIGLSSFPISSRATNSHGAPKVAEQWEEVPTKENLKDAKAMLDAVDAFECVGDKATQTTLSLLRNNKKIAQVNYNILHELTNELSLARANKTTHWTWALSGGSVAGGILGYTLIANAATNTIWGQSSSPVIDLGQVITNPAGIAMILGAGVGTINLGMAFQDEAQIASYIKMAKGRSSEFKDEIDVLDRRLAALKKRCSN